MTKIELHGHGPASSRIDTEHEVSIEEAFNGVMFITADGEKLAVTMRDSGFEVRYWSDHRLNGFDAGSYSFNTGRVHGGPTQQRCSPE